MLLQLNFFFLCVRITGTDVKEGDVSKFYDHIASGFLNSNSIARLCGVTHIDSNLLSRVG